MKCNSCNLRVTTGYRLRFTCKHTKCENHIYCKGLYRTCCDHPSCSCYVFNTVYPPHGKRDHCPICLSDDMKEHALFDCGHSLMCIDCYTLKFPDSFPDSRDFGATESEDDELNLFCESGKFAQRSRALWKKFMKASDDYEIREAKWYENRIFDACHVCRR